MPWNLSAKLLGLPTLRSVQRTDMSIVFDAVLFDRSLYNPLFNFLSSLAILLPQAKKKGRKLGFFNVTAGPVTTPMGKDMLHKLADQMDFITVRDQDSYDILRDIGVKNPNVLVTADAALNASVCSPGRVEEIWNKLGLAGAGEVLAINVNSYLDTWAGLSKEPLTREVFLKVFSGALNKVIKQTGSSVLFVSTQHQDEALTRELMSLTFAPKMALLSNKVYDHHEIKGVMSKVSLLYAMRLHCIIYYHFPSVYHLVDNAFHPDRDVAGELNRVVK